MAIVLTLVALVNEIKKVIKLGILLEIDIVYQKKKKIIFSWVLYLLIQDYSKTPKEYRLKCEACTLL